MGSTSITIGATAATQLSSSPSNDNSLSLTLDLDKLKFDGISDSYLDIDPNSEEHAALLPFASRFPDSDRPPSSPCGKSLFTTPTSSRPSTPSRISPARHRRRRTTMVGSSSINLKERALREKGFKKTTGDLDQLREQRQLQWQQEQELLQELQELQNQKEIQLQRVSKSSDNDHWRGQKKPSRVQSFLRTEFCAQEVMWDQSGSKTKSMTPLARIWRKKSASFKGTFELGI